jgi:uncharacterized protein involved in exopolysaccharide biosynthesis
LDHSTTTPQRRRTPQRAPIDLEDLSAPSPVYDSAGHRELLEFWSLIEERRWFIAVATAVVVGVTFLLSMFVLTRWYQGTAVVRPVSESMQGMSLEGYIGGFGGVGGGLLSALGEDDDEKQAQEYISIMRSYGFTVALMRAHDLVSRLEDERKHSLIGWVKSWFPGSGETPMWRLYKQMDARFDVNYSSRTGNIELDYLDQDPDEARRILSFYIDGLRELLRRNVIDSAANAQKALNEDVAHTSDPIVRQRLYDLIAAQLRRDDEAKAQSDFAFKVIESPVVPDKPHHPRPLLYSAIAAALMPILLLSFLRLDSFIRQIRREARLHRRHSETD